MDSNIEEIIFKYRFYLSAVILGIILILFGVVYITRQLPFLSQDKIEILSTEDGSGEVTVEVGGAVEKPGVYKMAAGARVEEALIMAGGLSASADREWVSRVLNRAAKLVDGQKIYIPPLRSSSSAGQAGKNTPGVPASNAENVAPAGWSLDSPEVNGHLIDINSASQAQLEALPGIGPVTAKKIIEGRPYSAAEELLTRKILGKKVYAQNKDKLSVY